MAKRKTGQASLELAASLTVVFILLFGTLQVFIWVNKRLAQRQQDYEATRIEADSNPVAAQDKMNENDATKYPKLDIFGQ